MNLSIKQEKNHRHRDQTSCCQRGQGQVEEEGWSESLTLVDVNKHIPTRSYLLNGTEDYIQSPRINHNGKEYFKKTVHMCKTESLCCTAQIDIILSIN